MRKLAVVVTLALLGALTALAAPGGAAAELAGGQLFVASLEAGQEVPATDATGSGAASFAYDEAAGEVAFVLGTYDLTDVTAAHIHIGGPGENGPHVANLFGEVEDGVTRDGTLARATLDDASVLEVVDDDTDEVTFDGTVAALVAAITAGEAYVNVHTAEHPDGAIRGQIAPVDLTEAPAFGDVDGTFHQASIEALSAVGIIRGRTTTSFDPGSALTRGQMAALIDRALHLPDTATDPFTDDETSPFEASINRLAAQGISLGRTATTYAPGDLVTRGQMASFLARALGLTGGAGLDLFPDAGPAHGESIDALAVAGITAGTSATTFSPSRQVNRAQTATFLARALGWVAPTPPVATTLTVLHNNDGESAVLPRGDEGGAGRFVAAVDAAKAQAEADTDGVVMLSSGDNFLAGQSFAASQETGEYYDVRLLERIGYDAIALGNHDFDFGPDVLAEFIGAYTEPQTYLSANLDFAAEPELQALVDAGTIAPSTVIDVAGTEVGVVGAITPGLAEVSSPQGVVIDPDVIGAVQGEIDALTADGVDKVILVSHLQSISEELALVPNLSGIDIVIAGGGDELLADPGTPLLPSDVDEETPVFGPYPLTAVSRDGVGVPVVTTTGSYSYLGRLIADFGPAGNLVSVDDASGPIAIIGGPVDAGTVAAVEDPVSDFVAELAATNIATSAVPLDGTRAAVRTRETNLGNLVADSLLWQGRQLAGSFGLDQPVIALQNGGGIRNDAVIPAGPVSRADAFTILPFDNFVAVVEDVPAATLLEILENAVSNVENVDGRFAQIAGFEFTYDPDRPAGDRVREVTLDDGTDLVTAGAVVPGAPTIDVATINFLAAGGDGYAFDLPFQSLGISYREALEAFVSGTTGGALNGQITAAEYPAAGEGRITAL
ncbi:MAG TPA: 5'-nucleotidase C-terminal domain-containing protein [Acidimicrobiales bacterium]